MNGTGRRFETIDKSEKGNPMTHTLVKTRASLLLRVMNPMRTSYKKGSVRSAV